MLQKLILFCYKNLLKKLISVSLTRWRSYIDIIEREELEKELKILYEKFKWETFSTSEDIFYFKKVHNHFFKFLKKYKQKKFLLFMFTLKFYKKF